MLTLIAALFVLQAGLYAAFPLGGDLPLLAFMLTSAIPGGILATRLSAQHGRLAAAIVGTPLAALISYGLTLANWWFLYWWRPMVEGFTEFMPLGALYALGQMITAALAALLALIGALVRR